MTKSLLTYLFIIVFLACCPRLVTAQLDSDYFSADQLLRQQKYEQAYQKFYKLHQEQPATFLFLDKAVECLINEKKYAQAKKIVNEARGNGFYPAQARIRLAEIFHISGDKERAFKIWNQVLQQYAGDQQTQLRVARSMKSRNTFEEAIKVYLKIRRQASASNVITSELADTYLQAGQYEKAIQEYLRLVKDDPNRMSFVQRRLIRFQDDYIYDVAILEISDFLDKLPQTNPSYPNLQQLEIWLLMERNLFERALVTAKNYESQSGVLTYSLYNLGSQLLAEQEFELAEQAYSYYIKNNVPSLKYRCMEEVAKVYTQWARHLENYNLGLSEKPQQLYQKAYGTLEKLLEERPQYHRSDQVLVSLAELSLDTFHNPQQADHYLQRLRSLSDSALVASEAFIEGRLHLYDKDYTRARIAFTRSNKQEHIGDLAEKTRYFLALTDFFAGDYEFAKIQLNALERQNTSYYANDAVQLRLWIQNGLQADSTGKKLQPFSKAIEYFSQGKDNLGIYELESLFKNDSQNPLIDEALVELSRYQNPENAEFIYRALSQFLAHRGAASPLYERLLWERARMADQFVTNKNIKLPQRAPTDTLAKNLFSGESESSSAIPTSVKELIPLYEKILMEFPDGFYATYVRDRIQELQNLPT